MKKYEIIWPYFRGNITLPLIKATLNYYFIYLLNQRIIRVDSCGMWFVHQNNNNNININ